MVCPSCGSQNGDAERSCFTCGYVFPAAPSLGKGSVIASRYEIMRPLGRGGMGIVYQAYDRVLDETVALKVLRSEVARDPEMARRFRSEIKLARKITHANVCRIHDYGEDGLIGYIAMELVEGKDLKQYYAEHGSLSTSEALGAAIQIVEGLQAIHDAGVVHRDLKTSNVMLDKNGRVRLMDFGIAKQVGSTGATALGHILGTPEYMSPEQARGLTLDYRSDIYSMGIVIYEMLSGHVPFRGDTPIATIYLTLERAPVLEGEGAAGIPAELVPILGKALAKEPGERYGSAHELAEALRDVRKQLFPGVPLAALRLAQPPPATIQERSIKTVFASSPATGPTMAAANAEPRMPTPTPITAPPATPTPRSRPAPEPELTVTTPTPTAEWKGTASPPPPPVSSSSSSGVSRRIAAQPAPPPPRRVGAWLALGSSVVILGFIALAMILRQILPIDERTDSDPVPTTTLVSTSSTTATTTATTLPAATSTTTVTTSTTTPTTTTTRPTPPPTTTLRPAVPPGRLQLVVRPWADVSVDGKPAGTTPLLEPISLPPGPHTVQLSHPGYKPIQRRVTIESGSTARLEVDLPLEAVAKDPGGVKP